MSKKITLITLILITALLALKIFTGNQVENSPVLSSTNTTPSASKAEKIEVVHFHATRQCWACITVGEYALEAIKTRFPKEYQSGKIVFRDINVELSENREIAKKYQAGGSSLFVNAISNGKDNIKEDIAVWRLINNQEKFADYFGNKLKTLLEGQ